ncbi:MAG: MATE family efflux transporter [Lachnospiraceae bacterium]
MAKTTTKSRIMTEGSIWKHLLFFAIPLLIGNLFQQLYNTVDSIVVGNFVGKEALAAVGTTDSIINTIIGFFMGMSTGAGVIISHYFGAKNDEGVHKAVHTTIAITIIMSVVFSILGVLLVPAMLHLMKTPDDVFDQSATYLRIYFAGGAGLMFYNMGSGIMRAVGDSKRPLYFLILSALINTVLDVLFVAGFHWGVAGAAIATIIAQGISAVLVMITLTREKESYRIIWSKIHIYKEMLGKIFSVGFPVAIQQAVTSFSNVFVQSYINNFGSACMAGWSSYGKIDKFCMLPMQSVALSVTTFVGQNLGSGNLKRAKRGSLVALAMSVSISVLMMIPILIFAPQLVGLFNQDPDVLQFGTLFLRFMMPFYACCCINQIYAGTLRGAGNALAPTIIMMSSFIVFRQIYLFVVSKLFDTIEVVAFGYPAGWIVCSIIMLIYYYCSHWEKKAVNTQSKTA